MERAKTKTIRLEPRLQQVADYVPPGAKLGDIGTDHAYLPLYLVERGLIRKAVAVDVHPGPYQFAAAMVRERGFQELIDVRLGDGLRVVQPGEADVLSLAGMGGSTILAILLAGPEVLKAVSRLIVQPQGAEGKVREALSRLGWKLWDERLVEEEQRLYSVIVFQRDQGLAYEEIRQEGKQWRRRLKLPPELEAESVAVAQILEGIIWRCGPLILKRADEKLFKVIQARIKQLNAQAQGIALAQDPRLIPRAKEVRLETELWRAINNKQ
ncbi:MAG: class I SAM-dependent methyltransferase [Peptococcaceae bacterium]|jgi:tRNA (adenine22-N1)-methyltransferase|nr:class I SAM-dependent methyltransferase [Peptococcaceae bacterium]